MRRRWFENLPGTAHVTDRFVMSLPSCDTDKKQGESDWPGTLAPLRRPLQQRLGNALVWVALRATDSSVFFKTAATTPTFPEVNVAWKLSRWQARLCGEGKRPGALRRLRCEHSVGECSSMKACNPGVLNLAVLLAKKVIPLQECTKQGRTYRIADKLANRIFR